LSAKYVGDFNLINFDGHHTSHRPMFFYDSVSIFFNNNLNVSVDFGDDNPYVDEEIKEEDLGEVQAPRKSKKPSGNDDFERAKQLSLQEAYTSAPVSQQEEEELLALALKLSLLEAEAPKADDKGDKKDKVDKKDKDEKRDKDTKDSKHAKDKDGKDTKNGKDTKETKDKSKLSTKKNQDDEKMVGLDDAGEEKVVKGTRSSGSKKVTKKKK